MSIATNVYDRTSHMQAKVCVGLEITAGRAVAILLHERFHNVVSTLWNRWFKCLASLKFEQALRLSDSEL